MIALWILVGLLAAPAALLVYVALLLFLVEVLFTLYFRAGALVYKFVVPLWQKKP
jgi:hypothetical protein